MACMLPIILRSVGSQIDTILTEFDNTIVTEFANLGPVVFDLDMLQGIVERMKFPTKKVTQESSTDRVVQFWLKKMTDMAHEADDRIGKLRYELLRTKLEIMKNRDPLWVCGSDYKLKGQGRSTFGPVTCYVKKIRKIRKKFGEMLNDWSTRKVQKSLFSGRSARYEGMRTNFALHSNIVGRKHEKEAIINLSEEGVRCVRFSYDHMPLKLKQCFLFFTLYPKGSTFYKDDIIRLWSASGLLEEMDKDPEDAGSILLEELQQWLIIEIVRTDYGANSGYIMHDPMHELAMFIAKDDFAIVTHDDLNYSRDKHDSLRQMGLRYLSIIIPDLPESFNLGQFCAFRTLRVLRVSSQCSEWNHAGMKVKIPEELFVHLKHLRSLILRDIQIEALPESVGNLKLLQYIDLTNTSIESIPESVCNLYNLKILELINCPLRKLPNGLGNLISLQYLIFNPCLNLPVSHGIGRLTNLKTLSRFEVQKCSLGCNLYELKDLGKLRKLYIAGLYNVARVEEAKLANLSSKTKLDVLRLDWSIKPSLVQPESTKLGSTSEGATHEQYAGLDPTFQEKLLDNLKPCTFLKELHVHKYCGSRFPRWLGDASFKALVKVSLIGGGNCCELLPSLGQLPSLKNLAIQSMCNLCCVGREFCSIDMNRKGFLSLKTLEFVDMVKWSAWTGVQSDEFCSLNTLRIVSCPELVALPEPLSSSLTKLIIRDCDTLASIPNLPTLAFLILAGEVSEDIFTCFNLPTLRSLKVSQSRNLRSLDINCKKLPLLEVLVISGCRNLQHVFGLHGLSSLKILKLSACKNLQFSLREKLPSTLVYLDISYSPKLHQWKEIQGKNYYEQLCYDANNEILKKLEELREAELELMIPSEEALNIEFPRRERSMNFGSGNKQ